MIEMYRLQSEGLQAYEDGGHSGFVSYASEDFKEKMLTLGAVGTMVAFPSGFTQLRSLPLLLRGGMSGRTALGMYGGNLLPFPTIAGLGIGIMSDYLQSRGGRDAKPGTTVPPVGPIRRPRPIKPSRLVSSRQTSKPFWSNGKPKCKKGFRYDFKRKLCVKIK